MILWMVYTCNLNKYETGGNWKVGRNEYVTVMGLEPTTTYFVNEHSTI